MDPTTNGRAEVNNAMAALISETLSRLDYGRRHGMQYDDRRDIYKAAGYKRTLNTGDFLGLYERDPLAARIVDMPANATWRKVPTIEEPDEPEGTEFTEAVGDLADRLGLWRRLARADRTARLGRYGILLIGTGADDVALRNEMPRLRGPEAVLYLASYREDHAQIGTWEADPRNPRFGMPLLYNVNVGSASGSSKTIPVHHSHVIHIAENVLDDDVYGVPALRRPFNALFDLQKISASTAEAFWQRVAGVLVGKIDPTAVGVTDEALEALDDQLKELWHDLRRSIFGQGLEVSRLAESEPNPEAASKLYIMLAAAGEGIPYRMLIGNETGERASSEDQKAWAGVVAERQQQHAEPGILRALLDRLVEKGALPAPRASAYDVVWPSLFSESESEIAVANKARADTAAALTPVGGDPLALVEIDEDRNIWLVPRKAEDPSPFDGIEPPVPGGLPGEESEPGDDGVVP